MSDLDYIKSKCIKANPDIVALKFGCWIKLKSNRIIKICSQSKENKELFYTTSKNGAEQDFYFISAFKEIIGRKIGLADVLLAMNKNSNGNWSSLMMKKVYSLLQSVEGWNLRNDDLTQQHPECIAYLADILK